jgi:predicted RNase H-like nuclease (RuvC/YqgF family)
VKEAAEFLGTTIDAVRGRIRRGTLDSVRLDGVVYVLLDATNREQHSNQSEPAGGDAHQQTADQSELVGELRGQIDWLRREVERKDTIIMSLTQRIPELEAPRGPQGATEESSEVSNEGEAFPEQQEPARRRSWWRRFFGIE